MFFRRRNRSLPNDAVAAPTLRRAPRIIGRDRARLLTHLERAGWIGGRRDLLAAWQGYAEDFIRARPVPSLEVRTWLMARGLSPDAAWLYPLDDAAVNTYISELQLRLLPLINGQDGAALLGNRMLFMQAFGRHLPIPALLTQLVGGRPVPGEMTPAQWLDGAQGHRLCVRPVLNANGPVTTSAARAPGSGHTSGEGAESPGRSGHVQVLGLAPASKWLGSSALGQSHRFKLFVLRHPRTRKFLLISACLVLGGADGRFADGCLSLPISVENGEIGPAVMREPARLQRNLKHAPWDDQPLPDGQVPGWKQFTRQLLSALDATPLLQWLQLDLDLSTEGLAIVDASDRLEESAFQVHTPLMQHADCRRFMMEYCL